MNRLRFRIGFVAGALWAGLVVAGFRSAAAEPAHLPVASPGEVEMAAERLAPIDGLIAAAIEKGDMPGCVLAIGRHGRLALLKAYGRRQVEPEPIEMTVDTVFDLASLTKPIATATSVMLLIQDGKIGLHDPVAKYIPEFAANGKDAITVFHLLTHQGGLIPDNSLKDYADGPEKAWERIYALGIKTKPGEKFVYTDVGFLVLGELVRRVSGLPVNEFARERIYRPLGMNETGYLPGEDLCRRAAPTERRGEKWMQGEVHDPRAYALGGVAGHAGLFSTAADLAVYSQMMLGRGEYGGVRVLDEKTFDLMTAEYAVPGGFRGLGWDKRSGYSSNRGRNYSPRAFGHGGFTGTVIWIDPELDLFLIFLSNRLHPDGEGSVNSLAGRIGAIAAAAIDDPAQSSVRESLGSGNVLTGIDVLQRDGFRLLEGRRVGLITNQTGINRDGVSTVQLLHEAKNTSLVALFSPEHGLEGKLDISRIGDSQDDQTGLHVFSLYGETRRPTAEMLKQIDTLVFDIQDIGARFYTYISTMGYAMEAAAEHGLRFVVLDRPNPIGGVRVEGPVLDAGRESFVAYHRLPVRHGMTVGELARLFRAELGLKLELEVVRVENWQRGEYFDETGLEWVNPSPNIRSLTEAILYPGVGLLETTNLSVGRGTPTPFELFGAPWIDRQKLAGALNALNLPGVRFEPIEFIPDASVFEGKLCQGVRVQLVDRDAFQAVRTGLEIARQLRLLYPDAWEAEKYDRLLGNRQVLDALLAGKTVAEIEILYQPELDAFLKRRAEHLLYQQ